MGRIFDEATCWNIFDHESNPEEHWALLDEGRLREARRAAIRLTIKRPLLLLPVVIACLRARLGR